MYSSFLKGMTQCAQFIYLNILTQILAFLGNFFRKILIKIIQFPIPDKIIIYHGEQATIFISILYYILGDFAWIFISGS